MTLEQLAELAERLEHIVHELERVSVRRADEDEWLTMEQASETTKFSTRWLYDNAKILPFVKRVDKSLRVSRNELQRWMASRPLA